MKKSGPNAVKALSAGILIASAITLPAAADLSLRLEGYAFGTRQQVAYNTANLWDETSSGDSDTSGSTDDASGSDTGTTGTDDSSDDMGTEGADDSGSDDATDGQSGGAGRSPA